MFYETLWKEPGSLCLLKIYGRETLSLYPPLKLHEKNQSSYFCARLLNLLPSASSLEHSLQIFGHGLRDYFIEVGFYWILDF